MLDNRSLNDIKIVDLTNETGMYCSKLFADLGADVIRIEKPGVVNHPKKEPPHLNNLDSLYYNFMNTSKRSITLNWETATGKEIFFDLVKEVDAIIETFPPDYLDGNGVGYSVLSKLNPPIVLTSITPFGKDGPYKNWIGSDLICMAMGGLMSLTGHKDSTPLVLYGNQSYIGASLIAAAATLMSIYHAKSNREGQQVDVSIQESITHSLENACQMYDMEGVVRKREGRKFGEAGMGLFPCQDGYVYLLCAYSGKQIRWEELVEWLKDERIADAEELSKEVWSDPEWRKSSEGMTTFRKIFETMSLNKTKLELYEEGQKRRISISPLSTPEDLYNNPQLRSRNFFIEVELPESNQKLILPGAPYKLSETPCEIKRPPAIGEHNIEVFCDELGYSRSDISALRGGGIV